MTTDGIPDAAARAFRRHDAFEPHEGTAAEPNEDAFDCTTTPFETTLRASEAANEGRDAQFSITVDLPTLDAVTEETVGDAVADGWFETLELRLEDAYDAPDVDPIGSPSIERSEDRITVTFRFRAWSANAGVDDAKAIVDYVEGTYIQGVVPGYTYQDPVRGLLTRAREHGGDEGADGAAHGGTPL